MSLAPPPPVSTSPFAKLRKDLRGERRATVPFPPGDTSVSLARTRRFLLDPLPLLLDAYERYGPVFTLRILHGNAVFMLGPEANHHMLVSHAHNFRWRDGPMGDLSALLGDGLLTIDGEFHRRSRQAMLPAFHRDRIAAASETIVVEASAAVAPLRPGDTLDLYDWTRRLALRIALRALFGFDEGRVRREGADMAHEFEVGLGFYGRDYLLQTLRGPGTPFARMQRARRRLDAVIFGEIDRRRRTGERGDDLLSLLLDVHDDDGVHLDDQHVRDEVMTLLFAGHDTTTSTVTFLFHELARNPRAHDALQRESDAVLDARAPGAADLTGTALPQLEMAIDETLRKFPAAWIGPRRSVEPFAFAGQTVPGGVPVNYSSWASHHLPDVFDDPDAFRPERFTPGAKAALPKGAYVPFGGGSRTCIGMRFGQAEVRAIASLLMARFRVELRPGYELRVRQTPTIGPRDGLPVTLRPRDERAVRTAA
jgi:cytochrome P450